MTDSPLLVPISLRMQDRATAKPSAWLLPGKDSALWLAEICAWQVPLTSLRLLPLPIAANDLSACGVLVIVPTELAEKVKPTAMAQPFAKIHPRLYIPAGARLHPPMDDAELSDWLRLDVNVLHPTIGLIGCGADELQRVADLIASPREHADEWNRAVPGIPGEPRLHSVKPSTFPSLAQIIGESRGDIGENAPSDLDPIPEESPLNRAIASGMQVPFRFLNWLARSLPQPGADAPGNAAGANPGNGWLQRMQEWSERRLAQLSAALEAARESEMTRLLRMLEKDPDNGLKYALPMGSLGRTRGRAPPSWRLKARNINFNLGSLFGSRPSDSWQSSAEMQRALAAKYRDLATRELQLGRYRRAAYILGELLRDLHGAADALKQGGFYREAAVIYRDQFKDNLAAARCLEKGGLLTEAIELYELAGQLEQAGDLYGKLGQHDRAETAYRLALEHLQARHDFLAAAKLLEQKLLQPDGALKVLTDAWPLAPGASACLAESFRLLERLSRHEDASQRIASLRDVPPTAQQMMHPLAEVLANVAISYAVSEVKSLAADATRVIAGLRLANASESEARQLVSSVRSVDREDKLLQRDGERYLADLVKRPPPAKTRPKPAPAPGSKAPVLVRAFQLTPAAQWRSAISIGSRFFAQGVRPNGLVIVHGDWNGKVETIVSGLALTLDEEPVRLRFASGHGLIALPTGGLECRPLQGNGRVLWNPPNLPPGAIFDIALDESGTLWVLHDDNREANRSLVLSSFDLKGNMRSTRFISFISEANFTAPPALSVQFGRACAIVENQMHLAGDRSIMMPFSHPAVSVVTSPLHTRWRTVVCFAEGGAMLWPAEQQLQMFGQGLIDPTACIMREGMLVVAARGAGSIYQINGLQLQHLAKIPLPDRPPIAVAQTHNAGEFGIFYSDGLVQVMRIP